MKAKTIQSKDVKVGMIISDHDKGITMRVEALDGEEDTIFASYIEGNEDAFLANDDGLYEFFYVHPTFQQKFTINESQDTVKEAR